MLTILCTLWLFVSLSLLRITVGHLLVPLYWITTAGPDPTIVRTTGRTFCCNGPISGNLHCYFAGVTRNRVTSHPSITGESKLPVSRPSGQHYAARQPYSFVPLAHETWEAGSIINLADLTGFQRPQHSSWIATLRIRQSLRSL